MLASALVLFVAALPARGDGHPCATIPPAAAASHTPSRPAPHTQAEIELAISQFRGLAASSREPSQQALAQSAVAAFYNALGRPNAARPWADRALDQVVAGRANAIEPRVRAVWGETAQGLGETDAALASFRLALTATRSDDRERPRLCNDIGVAFNALGYPDSALLYLTYALRARIAIADSVGMATVLNNMGRVYQNLARFDSADARFAEALAIRERVADYFGQAATLNNIGYGQELERRPDSSGRSYHRALIAARLGGHRSLIGLTLANMGRVYIVLGQLRPARDDLDIARAIKVEVGDSAGVAWTLHDLGRVDVGLQHLSAGIAELDQARRLLARGGDRIREASALYFLGRAYEGMGDPPNLRRAGAYFDSSSVVRSRVSQYVGRDDDRINFAEQDRDLTAHWVLSILRLRSPGNADSVALAALAVTERGRARALVRLMRTSETGDSTGSTGNVDAAGADLVGEARALLTRAAAPANADARPPR